MIEYDENGKEWFGYSLGANKNEPADVIATFIGNVQYLEWYFRSLQPKLTTLAGQFDYLFGLLPTAGVSAITDDKNALIAEIVRLRNRLAHGRFDEPAPSIDRLCTLVTKIAALITLAEMVEQGRFANVEATAGRWSPYLRALLSQTDKPR